MSQAVLTPPEKPRPSAASASAAAASSGAKLRHAAIIAAVLVVIGAVAGLVPRWQRREALAAETRGLAVQTVAIVSPAPGKAAPGLTLPAEVKALVEAPIYARASGYLKRWLVDIGAQVKAGDLLAEIDTPELNQELAQARAQLAQSAAALALAKTTAGRWTELLKTASVSEQETAEKKADLELKSANVEAAQANVRRLEELQSFQSVKAPFAGTITARRTDVGDLIAAGSAKELFRLAQTGTLRVYARVPQTTARGIAPGQTAEMTIPELPGRVFPAKVVRTAGAMSADSRTLLTELEVDNARGEILSGSYAQVRFTEARSQVAVTLPSNTLLFRGEGPQVGVVQEGGKVELRKVSIGRDFGPTVEIVEGVGQGDQVILNPADSLVSGVVVRVAEAPVKAAKEK
ncbi:MAG TPA: efflux RND transporter periplasmic adaptor subunit [Bacillota bacterium]|nr:efflux RND transporter periplasmic adaptor subunit [Bacillota bacterium]